MVQVWRVLRLDYDREILERLIRLEDKVDAINDRHRYMDKLSIALASASIIGVLGLVAHIL